MAIELPPLPYAADALLPHLSAETLEYHYGKHHRGYVDNLNKLVLGTEFEEAALDDIVRKATGAIFNNAAQVWNHSFYWQCLSPHGGGDPDGELQAALERAFGGIDAFRDSFTKAALGQFGSGWAWLVKRPDGNLAIVTTANASTPVIGADTPLLVCDVWEHAYYIDYRNARARYLEAFWKLVNWSFVAGRMR